MKTAKLMRRLGRITFLLMWVPFITLFIGMAGMSDGSYAWAELPPLARFSLVGVGILGGASTLLLPGAPIVSWGANRRLQAQGLQAEAKILKVWDSGTTVNENPVVRLLLEVRTPGGSTFEAETERLISRLQIPAIQEGNIVQVRYDPYTHSVALADED